MSLRNVRLIFLREVRDQLRDRRTLFMIAVLPLLLYPALSLGVLGMSITFNRQPRTVVVLGGDDLQPPLIDGRRFAAEWFDDRRSVDQLRVVAETRSASSDAENERISPGEVDEERRDQLLSSARAVREAQRELERYRREQTAQHMSGDAMAIAQADAAVEAAESRRNAAFSASGADVIVLIPDDLTAKLAAANERIARHDGAANEAAIPSPVVLYHAADEKSLAAFGAVRDVLRNWQQELLRSRLKLAGLPSSLPDDAAPSTVDVSGDAELSQALWSKLFPALLVVMTVTGAFYPAVDLAAGEKERGTMETLLICPASRTEIVLGKFLTVMLFSSVTALLNLLTMGLTGWFMATSAVGGSLSATGIFSPPVASIVWVVVLLVPLSALFSALCLSLATFARSSKEGQYHLTPLLLVTVGVTVFCLSPAVEITPLYSVLPVMGVSLLLRELLGGGNGFVYLAPVLLTSFGYAALALWWAVEQFRREEVLFRESEQFEPRLWLRKLLRDKADTPTFAMAGFCFVCVMLLQFLGLRFFATAATAPDGDQGTRTLQLLLIQQIAFIAGPAFVLGILLTRRLRRTFRLEAPSWRFLAVAAILPLALMPLAATLQVWLAWFFPPLPPAVVETLKIMSSDESPLWLTLLAFAVAPAVCEELAFRGFILSGFLKSGRTGLAIALSSFAFGLMHMIPQQVFNATLLGLVLGLIAVRAGSLLPCIVFHAIFNGTQVAIGRMWPQFAGGQYPWEVLAVCAVVSIVAIAWLIRTGRTPPADRSPPSTNDLVLPDEVPAGVA